MEIDLETMASSPRHPWRRTGPGFKIIATGLEQCALEGEATASSDRAQLERLFLSLT
jgi:hypothetical protein